MRMTTSQHSLFEHLIAPLIIGIVVLFGQFLLQPAIQERAASRTDLWAQKRDAYIDAIALVDKKYDSLSFGTPVRTGPAPTDSEINEIYGRLAMTADNTEIITMFQRFMDAASQDYHSPANRGKFILLLRSDLGQPSTGLRPEEVTYFRDQSMR